MKNLPTFFKHSFPPLIRRTSFISALLAIILTPIFMSGSFAANNTTWENWQPDVLILVMRSMSTGTSNTVTLDQVQINYSTAVSKEEAKNDLYSLNRASGWEVRNGNIETRTDDIPGAKPTTSSTFYTQPIIDMRTGRIPVEQFITGFKRYKNIELIFIAPNIPFSGPKDFENKFVKLHLIQATGSIRYKATVKDDRFNKLDFTQQPEETGSSSDPSFAHRVMMAVGLAAVVAIITFILTTRMTKARKTVDEESRNGS